MKHLNSVVSCIAIFFLFCTTTLLWSVCYNQKKEIEYKEKFITVILERNEELEKTQKNLDWLESHLQDIDEYIHWKDVMLIKGYESMPYISRSLEELNRERMEIIKEAVFYANKSN